MQDKLREIEALLECISKSDFESSEEYRKWVIERQRQLGVKLREGADEILDREEATAYINKLLQKGFKLTSGAAKYFVDTVNTMQLDASNTALYID